MMRSKKLNPAVGLYVSSGAPIIMMTGAQSMDSGSYGDGLMAVYKRLADKHEFPMQRHFKN